MLWNLKVFGFVLAGQIVWAAGELCCVFSQSVSFTGSALCLILSLDHTMTKTVFVLCIVAVQIMNFDYRIVWSSHAVPQIG